MAEGGPPPEVELHLLECPICLERLQQPKSLPCLHCFCQDCLGTYITKAVSGEKASGMSFPCPVCRRMTTPVNQVETIKENWAKQFPTNGVIQELIKLKEQSSEPLYCTPCQTKGKSTNPAQFWCAKVESGFCETCKVDYHDIVHIECDIIDLYRRDINKPKQKSAVPCCNQHDEKIVWYCDDHKLLGCNICVFKDHRRCEEVTTATEYFQHLKVGSQLTDMQAALKKAAEVMNSLVKDFDEQLHDMVKNQEIALQSLTDLRHRIDKQLDQLQQDCTDKLITLFKDEKTKLENSLRQCERLKNSMLNTLKSSIKATEENDIIETVMLYQRGEVEKESCKELVKEMSKTFSSVSIKHEIVPDPLTAGDNAMGNIIIEQQPRRFPVEIDLSTPPLLGRRVKKVTKFNIKTPSDKRDCCPRGVVYLTDDCIVISDSQNKKLKLFTDTGRYLDELVMKGYPCDLCLVDNHTVAVAVYSPGGVHVVKVDNSKLTLSSVVKMPNDKHCYGITYVDSKFVVSTGEGQIYTVTPDDIYFINGYRKVCHSLAQDPLTKDTIVSVANETEGECAVSRLTDNHTYVNTELVVGVVWHAAGVDTDREGNIYVCGRESHNVVQMSGEGTHVRELLTASDGIVNPWGIAIRGETMLITTNVGCDVRVFKLY